MKSILLSLFLLSILEICPNPYGSDDAEYVKFYCPSECVLSDGEGVIEAGPGVHIAARNKTAFYRHFGFIPDIEFSKNFSLSNSGEEVCVNDECFFYGRDIEFLDEGVVYFSKNGSWDFRYEDWSDFEIITDFVSGRLIITPSNYRFDKPAMVASYTFSEETINAEELFIDASPPNVPCKELELDRPVHFLASSSYRNFHYKFAVSDSFVIVTTENWRFAKKGYIIEFESQKIAGRLKKLLQNDLRYESNKPQRCSHWKKAEVDGEGKEITFESSVTLFILPDRNPVFDFISSAKKRLYIRVPYMDFGWYKSGGLFDAIKGAKDNGAEVVVILDSVYGRRSETIEKLEEIGVRVTFDEKIHGKAVVADDRLLITSANFNMFGFKLNREIGLIIDDAGVANFVAEDMMKSEHKMPLYLIPSLVAFVLSLLILARTKDKF
jgi:hypothetical protein